VTQPTPASATCGKAESDKSHLAYLGHALMENRNGLVVDAETTPATGTQSGKWLLRFLLRPRMRLVIHLGQMLKVQMRIDLRRRQAGVAEHFLHRAQIAG
jgi:hypothetical protein